MSAHTPGPWQYLRSPSGPIRVGPSHNCTVAVAPFPPTGDQEANARLIAAAPELFDALNALVNAVSPDDNDKSCEPYFRPALKAARAALAKAQGVQP